MAQKLAERNLKEWTKIKWASVDVKVTYQTMGTQYSP